MKATHRSLAAILLAGALLPTDTIFAQTDEDAPPARSRRQVVYEEVYDEEEAEPVRRAPTPKRAPVKKPARTWEPAQPRSPQVGFGSVQRVAYGEGFGMAPARPAASTGRVARTTASRANYQVESPFDSPEPTPNEPTPAEPLYEPTTPSRSTPPPRSTPAPRSSVPRTSPSRSSAPAPIMEDGNNFVSDDFNFDGGYEGAFDGGFDGVDGFPCDGCDTCGPCRGPAYVRGEYLLWWLTGDTPPAMVTTSPTGTTPANAGVIGAPGTTVLFGDQPVNNTGRSGARITAGWWINPTKRIEGEVFGLGGQTSGFFENAPNGSPILARPFFNLNSGQNASLLVAYPGTFTGGVDVHESSNFVGAGLQFMHALSYGGGPNGFRHRFDFLYGFRYLGLYENLTAEDTRTSIAGTLSTFDGFKTSNSFFGGNIGTAFEASRGRWTWLTIGRLGLGGTNERVSISGNSVATVGSGSPVTTAGGLLAMPSNIGTYSHSGFTLVPQLETKLTFVLTPAVRLMVGYDIMYWSRVARPGQQIDTWVNPTQTGTPGPIFGFRETQLLVQGLSTGVEIRF